MDISARASVGEILGWGQTQATIFLLDFIFIWFIYSQVRPSSSMFLLAVLSSLKAQNVVWFYIAADYKPEYPDWMCAMVLVGLETGWLFYDHIASISTFYLIQTLPIPKNRISASGYILCLSVAAGAVLRVGRSSCRFGHCWMLTKEHSDTTIVANVLFTEFFMMCVFLEFFYKLYVLDKSDDRKPVLVTEMIRYGLLRVGLLIPFGIMEAVAYEISPNPKVLTSIKW